MVDQFDIRNASDIGSRIEEAEKKLSKQCYLDGDQIIINVDYEYVIELNRCSSPEDILGWVVHLCSKGWITPSVIRRFICIASKAHGIEFQPI